MKLSLSLAVLALAASQAMAVVPIPVKECTKTVVVLPTDLGCEAFAAANGCTFPQLLTWNLKLRPDCLNLDVGAPLCVSVTKGVAGGNNPSAGVPPVASSAPAPPAATSAANGGAAKPTGVTPPQATGSTKPIMPSTVSAAGQNAGSSLSVSSSMVLAVGGVLASVAYML